MQTRSELIRSGIREFYAAGIERQADCVAGPLRVDRIADRSFVLTNPRGVKTG